MALNTLTIGDQSMAGKIVNRLDEVRQRREKQSGEKLTWEKVAADTGLAYSTVLRWARNRLDRYDDKALVKFCEYFGVQPGDILVYEPDKD
jgi:DNA-binding Xre family transcriptional regulator